ncbi:MAG TPA: hypothetical protein VF546_05140 [Pyrinomonadaceae bacterium]|jgi:hypothetical protein
MSSNAARVSKSRRGRQSKVTQIAENRAQRAAARTGKQETEIERLPFDLSALEEEGVFVNVDASGFGILDRRIDWQALGIRLPQESDVAFHPPRCGVLPNRFHRPLLTPATQAHQALHKYSYQFRLTETLFETPAYRWIPWRAFSEFETAFERAVGNLNEAKRTALDNYDAIRAEVLETFTALAEDSAQRLLATGTVVDGGFRERIINGVLDALPGEEELRDKLSLRYQVGVILLGSEMLREQRLALAERHRIERAEAIREQERSEERAAAAVVQQQLWAEQESARLRLVAQREELAREQAVKERIRQLKLDAAREKLQETLSPLQEGAAQLRAQVYESAVKMHEALAQKEFLPGATAKKARNMARWFRLMNFQSDDELERLVVSLERLAAKPDSRKKRMAESASVKAVLDDIIELTYRDAQALTQPSRMTALEL